GCPVEKPALEPPQRPASSSVPPIPVAWTEKAQAEARPAVATAPAKSPWAWLIGGVVIVIFLVAAARSCTGAPNAQSDVPLPVAPTAAPVAAPVAPTGPTEADKIEWASDLDNADATSTVKLNAAKKLIDSFGDTPE